MRICFLCLVLTTCISESLLSAEPPKVWIYSDISDPTLAGNNKEGTINDPDDVSAMAGYLLVANEFDTLGIVVASTHRDEHATTPDQAVWADQYFGDAYRNEVAALNESLDGYPADITFQQSCIKESAERFDPQNDYASLDSYDTVAALLNRAEQDDVSPADPIHVLCWGSLTEPAILVKHCLTTGKANVLNRMKFIAHWTNSSLHQGTPAHPEHVANCREDAKACAYLKSVAAQSKIVYHECGAIGQHGIVSGAPSGKDYYEAFRTSRLGTLFVEGKFAYGSVDHSDSATYWVLMPGFGVTLDDIPADGTNTPAVERANEQTFRKHSRRIHDELLRRSQLAAGDPAD
ncbi:nucleoside hydrolase-like domain-containing protein [Crateriforma conspicua]|uniref:Cellulose-binding Sde182 nucleoside hydrolase-like domain-containing protein n=1 Tax=Crateriforma conspicua TaxID=2527996 RepID=A0A5C5Y526_9PLAN|nr:nucleoside hydrolase-like domain-containing protein [Crateriforma conspicua]TWT68512.1 hypothetical protein Pan14r_07580 [Crateriforma conspicua]